MEKIKPYKINKSLDIDEHLAIVNGLRAMIIEAEDNGKPGDYVAKLRKLHKEISDN